MARDVQITFDCADPAGLAAFWAEALGYQMQGPPEGFESWEQALQAMGVPPESRNDASAVVDAKGSGPRLFFSGCRRGSGPRTVCTSTCGPPLGSWATRG